uniref:Uncharacterized protein n=1 Tax=Cacopsylla melanoneura TaxID=428564 RepID=A0A8D9BGL7_9HEMI
MIKEKITCESKELLFWNCFFNKELLLAILVERKLSHIKKGLVKEGSIKRKTSTSTHPLSTLGKEMDGKKFYDISSSNKKAYPAVTITPIPLSIFLFPLASSHSP